MKRFITNITLAICGFFGFVAMAGSALLEDKPIFQLLVVLAAFYICAASVCTLAKRLADHLPDEEC